jgi:hypothetical protein
MKAGDNEGDDPKPPLLLLLRSVGALLSLRWL